MAADGHCCRLPAGFVDPLLSTGFPLTLLGVARLAEIFEHGWETEHFASRLQTYAAQTEGELLATGRLIASLYANMNNFSVFTSLSLLYFATAQLFRDCQEITEARIWRHPSSCTTIRSLVPRAFACSNALGRFAPGRNRTR